MHVRRSKLRLVTAVVVAAVSVGGCTSAGPDPEEVAASEAMERRFEACIRLGEDIAAALQGFVDQFSVGADGLPSGPASSGPSVAELQASIDEFARRRAAIGCDAREFQVILNRVLPDVEGQGPYAAAVAARLRNEVAVTDGPPETVTVRPGDDLAAAVHGAGADALIELEAGTHVLDEPLVLLQDTHIVGAGPGAAVIESTARDAALVHGGGGTLRLEGLTITHTGSEPASVLVVTDGGHVVRDVTVSGGVADPATQSGWGLVLVGGTAPDGEERVIDGLAALDNEAGGIVVAGAWAPELRDVTARGNGRCGICWLELAGGSLVGGAISENELGLSVAGVATPALSDLVVRDNSALGVLVEEGARPTLSGLELRDNGEIGLAVRADAAPVLSDVLLVGHGEVALATEGRAEVEGNRLTVEDAGLGVFVRGESIVALRTVRVAAVREAHVVLGGSSSGVVDDVMCAGDAFGVVLLDTTSVEVGEVDCEVVDQR